MHSDDAALLVVAMLALGLALSFAVADRTAPTSRAMAAALASIGAAVALNVLVAAPMHARHEVPVWDGVFAIPETLAVVFAVEWLLRVLRTIPEERLGEEAWLRLAQCLAVFYGVVSLALPDLRAHQFVNILRHDSADIHVPEYPAFLLFAGPLVGALLLSGYAGLRAYRRHPDRAEAKRVIAFVAGAPFLAAALILPVHAAPFAAAAGLIVFSIGAVRFHVAQGRRAEFMARFLAPQVAEMVLRHGVENAMRVRTLEISVVCCDLRGFTAFTVETHPRQVIEILREYYDAVGAAAAAHAGTIKDQAGDGVLLLVGAPIPFTDHRARALDLAREIRRRGQELTQRRSNDRLHLGIGVGVATGTVTVGVIGAGSRHEYTAVGPAVNLAARLCAEAAHGEVLAHQQTVAGLDEQRAGGLQSQVRMLRLKGYPEPEACHVLADD
ncbi:MAG: adenylate/guanylate cyclase domain-containing protein [Burkholderiales bacterium]|nr:adenylate/guanylate cyclase domain-containing protein [Burkholderiales bacterium]